MGVPHRGHGFGDFWFGAGMAGRDRSIVELSEGPSCLVSANGAAQVSVLVFLRSRIRRATPGASRSPTVSNQGVTPFDRPRESFVRRHFRRRIVVR